MSTPPGFRRLGEEVLYRGSLVTLAKGEFESPDGERFEREIIHHPGAVVIVPVVGGTTVLAVRQYRAAVGDVVLELPAGKRDVEGEAPEVTAARELTEEVGREASSMELLGRFYNSAGFSDELTWCYLARGLRIVADDRQGVEERAMTVVEVGLDDVEGLVSRGELIDAKTIIGMCLARQRLG